MGEGEGAPGATETKMPEGFLKNRDSVRKRDPRIVLYLGAGASHFAGYRTFADFPVLIFDPNVRQAEGLSPLPPNAERLLSAIKDSLERTDGWTTHDRFLWRLNEYQHLLDLNQADPALQPFLRDATKLYDLFLCTTEAINVMANTTVRHYSGNRVDDAHKNNGAMYESMRGAYELYVEMAKLNGPQPYLPIFTTNYDMLIEDLCGHFRDDAGSPILVNGLPDMKEEGGIWTCSPYDEIPQARPVLHLFRLHGCACWFYHSTGDGNIYFHRVDAGQQSVRKLCAMYPGLERERGAGPHGHSFRAFHDLLQVCELIIFIGFSFRDDDVMHVLLKALADRRGALRVLIVDNMYTKHNVQGRLREAERRSTFPTYVPYDDEITSLRLDFGLQEGFAAEILRACVSLIGKENRR